MWHKLSTSGFGISIDISNNVDGFNIRRGDKLSPALQIRPNQSLFYYNPTVIVADPFLFSHNNELYLFYEKQRGIFGAGIIEMIKTTDLKSWSKPICVLKESFHLSYPNVFTLDGRIYMLPETGHDQSLRLYESDGDLTRWRLSRKIKKGESFVDSTIYKHNGLLYLFTTIKKDDKSNLHLFISDKIDGEWSEHPHSPIAKGVHSRCGGSIISLNGQLFRPAQRCDIKYGDGLDILEINELSPTKYKETIYLESVLPLDNSGYNQSGHHLNLCHFKDSVIIATDAIFEWVNITNIIQRIIQKIRPKTK